MRIWHVKVESALSSVAMPLSRSVIEAESQPAQAPAAAQQLRQDGGAAGQ